MKWSGMGVSLPNHAVSALSGLVGRSLTAFVLGASLSVGVLSAAPVTVKDVKASSTAPESMGVTFSASNSIDGKVGTAFCEGEAAAGLGEWVEYKFDSEITLSRIELYNGNWYSRDFFERHNRLKVVQVKFSNNTTERWELVDKMEKQVLTLKAPVKTRSVRFVFKEVYPGTTFNDTYISEMRFFDTSPGELIEGIKTKASSSLPPDGGGSYGPDQLLDGLTDTPWCEGKKDLGVGETIAFTLPAATALKELQILNGVAVNEETFGKNARPTRIKLELDGKLLKEAALTEGFGAWNTVPLEGARGGLLRLTVLEAAAGSSYQDTCMSELKLLTVAP